MKVALLLLAAGRGSRFGGPVPKAFLELAGAPLLVHSAERLMRAVAPPTAMQLLLVIHPDDRSTHLARWLPRLRHLVSDRGTLLVVDGGGARQESMQNGLAAVAPDTDLVLVHDAARALLPIIATGQCIDAARATGAATLAIPLADTLKRVDGTKVVTLDRTGIWIAQTPQVIGRELLVRASAHANGTGYVGTDDVSLVEHLGAPIAIVMGSPTNLKITQKEDLPLAAAILAAGLA